MNDMNDKSNNNDNIMGRRIEALRNSKKMSQEELGSVIGVKRAAINKYERGTVTNIPKENVEALAEFFGVSPTYLYGWDDDSFIDSENRDLEAKYLKKEFDLTHESTKNEDDEGVSKRKKKMDISKNMLLYGPPGTGKTYNTVIYAVAIIENKELDDVKKENYSDVWERFNTYKEEGFIEFTTFHQSYGYEEFIEGIHPTTNDRGDVVYKIKAGIFKKFCYYADDNWWRCEDALDKLEAKLKEEALEEKSVRKVRDFCLNDTSTGGISNEEIFAYWYGQQYSVDESEDKRTIKSVVDALVDECDLPSSPLPIRNHVFIIDEINRGNISKIFGELITLIEDTKRVGVPKYIKQDDGMTVRLPYSRELFGVPNNVYIIGTMNTADRSIATIDTALRRRFRFKEMMPDANVLKEIFVKDISISEMLTRMNKRISVLYDREHTIGHAYFMPLKDNPTIEQLAEIFENAIVPLLQEYFYEDYEKIRLILGDNNKDKKEEQFIVVAENDYNELFGSVDVGFEDSVTYEINREAFGNIESYRLI